MAGTRCCNCLIETLANLILLLLRHSSNILIKTNTAEVVHIDLGIAFEQGIIWIEIYIFARQDGPKFDSVSLSVCCCCLRKK